MEDFRLNKDDIKKIEEITGLKHHPEDNKYKFKTDDFFLEINETGIGCAHYDKPAVVPFKWLEKLKKLIHQLYGKTHSDDGPVKVYDFDVEDVDE